MLHAIALMQSCAGLVQSSGRRFRESIEDIAAHLERRDRALLLRLRDVADRHPLLELCPRREPLDEIRAGELTASLAEQLQDQLGPTLGHRRHARDREIPGIAEPNLHLLRHGEAWRADLLEDEHPI